MDARATEPSGTAPSASSSHGSSSRSGYSSWSSGCSPDADVSRNAEAGEPGLPGRLPESDGLGFCCRGDGEAEEQLSLASGGTAADAASDDERGCGAVIGWRWCCRGPDGCCRSCLVSAAAELNPCSVLKGLVTLPLLLSPLSSASSLLRLLPSGGASASATASADTWPVWPARGKSCTAPSGSGSAAAPLSTPPPAMLPPREAELPSPPAPAELPDGCSGMVVMLPPRGTPAAPAAGPLPPLPPLASKSPPSAGANPGELSAPSGLLRESSEELLRRPLRLRRNWRSCRAVGDWLAVDEWPAAGTFASVSSIASDALSGNPLDTEVPNVAPMKPPPVENATTDASRGERPAAGPEASDAGAPEASEKVLEPARRSAPPAKTATSSPEGAGGSVTSVVTDGLLPTPVDRDVAGVGVMTAARWPLLASSASAVSSAAARRPPAAPITARSPPLNGLAWMVVSVAGEPPECSPVVTDFECAVRDRVAPGISTAVAAKADGRAAAPDAAAAACGTAASGAGTAFAAEPSPAPASGGLNGWCAAGAEPALLPLLLSAVSCLCAAAAAASCAAALWASDAAVSGCVPSCST